MTSRKQPYESPTESHIDMDVITTKTFPTYTLSNWDLTELLPEPSEAVSAAPAADLESAV